MARILLAEDDDGVRAFVSRALAHMGHDVVEAEDGGLAAEVMQEEQGRSTRLANQRFGVYWLVTTAVVGLCLVGREQIRPGDGLRLFRHRRR